MQQHYDAKRLRLISDRRSGASLSSDGDLTALTPPLYAPGPGSRPATSAQGLGSPLPHLHRDWAHPCHVCAGTWLTPCHICTRTPATSAPGLSPTLPHLHCDGADALPDLHCDRAQPGHICSGTWAHPCHICTGTELNPPTSASRRGSCSATSAPGLGPPLLPHLHRDWAHALPHLTRTGLPPSRICTAPGSRPAASVPGLGSPLPHLRRDSVQSGGSGGARSGGGRGGGIWTGLS